MKYFFTFLDVEQACQTGWLYHAGHCYYISDNERTYSEAEAACVNNGSTLTSIHDSDENSFLGGKLFY